MSSKLKVCILAGGKSSEHEVSLNTGKNVFENLDRTKYLPIQLKITKEGSWFLDGKITNPEKAFKGFDIVFNALHGTFGEDGRIQALMEYYGVRYTGSGITASALAMDKLRSREVFRLAGLDVPKTLKIRKSENYQAVVNVFVNKVVNYPVVIKPCSNGSSVGVSVVHNSRQLIKGIELAFSFEKKILIEEFISGREVTCGVLDNYKGQQTSALPITEIIPVKGHKFFNYDAKYKTGHSYEITPAVMEDELTRKVQEVAVKTHQLLGCRAYSRTDMIIRGGKIYVLEINTLPGLTNTSLLPQAAHVAGLTFGQLLDKVIESSLI